VTSAPLLALSGISKRFGDVVALDGVDLGVREGTIHAVLGENGAGKTTLMRIAYGMVRADTGTLAVNGREVRLGSPRHALALGIGMVHQHFSSVPSMTVAENVALGGHGLFAPGRAAERVREIGKRTGLVLDPHVRAGDLPVGAQQRLELVTLIATGARVLILDEPTAVLAPTEATDLLAWLRGFAASGGAVVLVTHKIREALAVADEVTVLRSGRVRAYGPVRELPEDVLLATMFPDFTGQDSAAQSPTLATSRGPAVVIARHVVVRDSEGRHRIDDASFRVNGGEILGVVGVEGAGHAELLRALAGVDAITSGELDTPPECGFVPEDRHRDALIADFSLVENTALHGAGALTGVVRWTRFAEVCRALIADFDVRTSSERALMRTLSGGNQQKFILGRELREKPALLVAENPTRGLDFQATAAVHARLRQAANDGVAVIVYSSDLDEVLALASRVLVVHDARVQEVPPDREVIGRTMVGAA
jgi:general nucleoside transport system ATP-binding protein